MTDNETIADIIAWLRKPREGENAYLTLWRDEIADRLDAAHKREVDALNEQIADLRQQRDLWSKRSAELVEKCNEQYAKLKQVGNAAKLREALVQVQKKIKYLIGNLTVPNSLVASRMEINGIINAALAAPPRNCDKYPTFNDAIRALADKRGWHDAKWDSERYCILASWLFAPATEKEGGNDEQKQLQ